MTAVSPVAPVLLLTTGARVPPELLEAAIARAHQRHERLHVVIPAVLPPTLPISALPPHLAATAERPAEVVLVGRAGWSLRRAARGIAPVTVTSDRGLRPSSGSRPDGRDAILSIPARPFRAG
jgi:hypothetical protein